MKKFVFFIVFVTLISIPVFAQNSKAIILGKWQVIPTFDVSSEGEELNIIQSDEDEEVFIIFFEDGTGISKSTTDVKIKWEIEGNKIILKHSGGEFSGLIKIINDNTIAVIEEKNDKKATIGVFVRIIDK